MKRAGQQTLFSFYKKRNVKSTDFESDANSSAPESGPDASRKLEGAASDNEVESTENQTQVNASHNHNNGNTSSDDASIPSTGEDHAAQSDASPTTRPHTKAVQQWIGSLDPPVRDLLSNEIENIGDSWLEKLHPELTKPYFKSLKEFLRVQEKAKKVIFPLKPDVYSWSKLCRLDEVKVVILGQDPYHNHNQAHGLAFSVLPPTAIPPSLRNIYKELGNCYPDYKKPTSGLLTPWAKQGVLLLNACLTVEAHKANSHANKGWETFTERVLELVAKNDKVVFMAWGTPAFKRISKINPDKRHLVLKSVHPSPLSASRGWFGSKHFTQANDWLEANKLPTIDWQV